MATQTASLSPSSSPIAIRSRRALRGLPPSSTIQAAGNLARVVSGLVAEPITSEEELEVALGRIRDAVSAELAAGKQVRIQ